MIPLSELKKAAAEGLAFLKQQEDVEEAEVFVSSNGVLLTRLNYTSHIPCNGVEEPKSLVNYGVGVQAVFKAATARCGSRGSGRSRRTCRWRGCGRRWIRRGRGRWRTRSSARWRGRRASSGRCSDYHDPKLMEMKDADLVDAGWRVVNGGLRVFETSESLMALVDRPEKLTELGLIIGGDTTILQERMAIASHAMPEVQTDESTLIMSFITSMVEREESKGSGYGASTTLAGFTEEPGREAARNAIAGIGGVRLPTGDYRVVFGREAVMEILHYIVVPGLEAGIFYAQGSPFMGKLGQQIASEKLTIVDDGAAKGLVGAKGITCEGLPTGRTELIKDGRLVGLLANHYESQRLQRDPAAKEKLGVDPKDAASALVPRNGFRFARGGGRHFSTQPGIHATNVVVPGDIESTEAMCRLVGNGIYIGRIWYTYPVNGLRAGDFTGTVVADSYVIKDGKLAEPVKPNTLRINENVHTLPERRHRRREGGEADASLGGGRDRLRAGDRGREGAHRRDRGVYGGALTELGARSQKSELRDVLAFLAHRNQRLAKRIYSQTHLFKGDHPQQRFRTFFGEDDLREFLTAVDFDPSSANVQLHDTIIGELELVSVLRSDSEPSKNRAGDCRVGRAGVDKRFDDLKGDALRITDFHAYGEDAHESSIAA